MRVSVSSRSPLDWDRAVWYVFISGIKWPCW